jgi:hypothetical protein
VGRNPAPGQDRAGPTTDSQDRPLMHCEKLTGLATLGHASKASKKHNSATISPASGSGLNVRIIMSGFEDQSLRLGALASCRN